MSKLVISRSRVTSVRSGLNQGAGLSVLPLWPTKDLPPLHQQPHNAASRSRPVCCFLTAFFVIIMVTKRFRTCFNFNITNITRPEFDRLKSLPDNEDSSVAYIVGCFIDGNIYGHCRFEDFNECSTRSKAIESLGFTKESYGKVEIMHRALEKDGREVAEEREPSDDSDDVDVDNGVEDVDGGDEDTDDDIIIEDVIVRVNEDDPQQRSPLGWISKRPIAGAHSRNWEIHRNYYAVHATLNDGSFFEYGEIPNLGPQGVRAEEPSFPAHLQHLEKRWKDSCEDKHHGFANHDEYRAALDKHKERLVVKEIEDGGDWTLTPSMQPDFEESVSRLEGLY